MFCCQGRITRDSENRMDVLLFFVGFLQDFLTVFVVFLQEKSPTNASCVEKHLVNRRISSLTAENTPDSNRLIASFAAEVSR